MRPGQGRTLDVCQRLQGLRLTSAVSGPFPPATQSVFLGTICASRYARTLVDKHAYRMVA